MTAARNPQGDAGLWTQAAEKVLAEENGPASLATIAREELARIYSGLVREHHGNNWPLPARDTDWERRRLSRAARALTRGDNIA